MATYDSAITRDASDDPLVPEPVAAEIVKAMPEQSALMRLARKVRMSSKTRRMPVLSVLPTAYFVDGDTGLKQTSSADWQNVNLIAEELAVLVPIPESYLADSQVPIWDEVRPLVTEAIGAKLDAAGLFGTDKPTTWPESVYIHAIAAGNAVIAGTGDDLAQDISDLAEDIAEDGFDVSGFASKAGFKWRMTGLRSTDGAPIYHPGLPGSTPASLYGFPLGSVKTDAWDATEALLIAGDWSKVMIGIRQDITFTRHTDAVISDADGAVVYNAMQQDSIIYRAVFRVAYALANPATRINTTEATRSPFGVLQATTAGS